MTQRTLHEGRDVTVDALRALAILMVVVTHLLNLRPEFKGLAPRMVDVIIAFNMPLFVFLSGYVASGKESAAPLRFLRRKALALLVPYVAWVSVMLPLRHIPVSQWFPRIGEALVNPHAGFQMWFLWVLFVMFAIFVAERYFMTSDLRTLAVAVAFAGLTLLPLPQTFGIDKIAWLYPFFVAGYLVRRFSPKLHRLTGAAALAGVIGFPALLALEPAGTLWRFPTTFAGIACAWAIYRQLPPVVLHAHAWVGRRTLGVYGAQMVALPFLVVGAGWLGAIASAFTVLAGSLTVAVLLDRIDAARVVFLGARPAAFESR